jgi:hypothetical protein
MSTLIAGRLLPLSFSLPSRGRAGVGAGGAEGAKP